MIMSDTMRMSARVEAPVPDVHRALTEAAALRTWLAEYAEVDLPHRFEFWGRYTPEGDAPHQRLLYVDDHTLRFSWLLEGEETTVEFTLQEESAGSTIVALSQTHFPGLVAAINEENILGMMQTYWCLSIANLIDYVEGRELTPKTDFTSPRMREVVLIDAPAGAVYDSLVDAETFSRWFGANVGIEPHVGGRFAMGGFDADPKPAKIIVLEPGRKVTLAWDEGMTAGWELAESEGKTRLTFVQSGFDEKHPPYDAWMGWLSGIAELRRFHELRPWRPVWVGFDIPGMPEGMLTTGEEH
jgi:uncharacterized protein YndB with AHSA1/START domain